MPGARFDQIVDDLTGQLASAGSGQGGRSAADPYVQTLGPGSGPQGQTFAPAPVARPSGPVSPIPAVQLATAPMGGGMSQMSPSQQAKMMAPMDPSMSMQQAMAMHADTGMMRPPYTTPYGPAAFAMTPGFQSAPVSALQAPNWSSQDTCGGPATQLRASPGQQLQAVQAQHMAQLQARQAQRSEE